MGESGKQPLWKVMREARASAEAVREHFRADEPPIAVARIASGMGIELAEGFGTEYAGHLVLSEDRALIWTSTQETREQRRFTLAYLLGHVLRFPHGEYFLPLDRVDGENAPEASAFARELLIPASILERLRREVGADESGLHQRLGVSRELLELRMRELGPAPHPVQPPHEEKTQLHARPRPRGRAPDDGVEEVDDFEEVEERTEIARQIDLPPELRMVDFADRTEPAGEFNRRRYPRAKARFEVRFSLPGHAANAFRAYSRDISAGGLCLKTTRAHRVGDPLELAMTIGDESFKLVGAVAWVRGDAIGVRFVEVSEDDQARLSQLVQSLPH